MKLGLVKSLAKEAIDNWEKDDCSCTAEEVADHAIKLSKELCNPFDRFAVWVAGIFILTFYKGRTFREVPAFDIDIER